MEGNLIIKLTTQKYSGQEAHQGDSHRIGTLEVKIRTQWKITHMEGVS